MRICILGATGLVGRETIDLCHRAWPNAEQLLFASRDQTLEHGGNRLEVFGAERLEQADATKGDLALVALDDAFSQRYVPRLIQLGYKVVDKSNTYRLDPKVPLVVAGVNGQLVTDDVNLVANPNCTTIPYMLAMGPVSSKFGLTATTLSTYQAISGAGISALKQFGEACGQGYANFDLLGLNLDPTAYSGNTVPHNGKTDDTGFSSEERKLVNESRKILDQPGLAICAQCCRVPVAVGHYISGWFTVGEPATTAALEEVLRDAPFVRLLPGAAGDGLSALSCVHERDRALVGRLRPDPRDQSGRTFCITVAADNLRLGAATNAVRVASRWFETSDPELSA